MYGQNKQKNLKAVNFRKYKNLLAAVFIFAAAVAVLSLYGCKDDKSNSGSVNISTPAPASEARTTQPQSSPDTEKNSPAKDTATGTYTTGAYTPTSTADPIADPTPDIGTFDPTLPFTPSLDLPIHSIYPPIETFRSPFPRTPIYTRPTPEYSIPEPPVTFSIKSQPTAAPTAVPTSIPEGTPTVTPTAVRTNTPAPVGTNDPKHTSDPNSTSHDITVNKIFEDEVVELINKERAKYNLKALSSGNELLTKTAELRAEECIINFSHTRPDGSSCFTAFEQAGLSFMNAGENIAYGYSLPQSVVNGWMNSPGHRENILSTDFTQIGVGCVYYKGTYYWAQSFIG